jgi:hypothetical protein
MKTPHKHNENYVFTHRKGEFETKRELYQEENLRSG